MKIQSHRIFFTTAILCFLITLAAWSFPSELIEENVTLFPGESFEYEGVTVTWNVKPAQSTLTFTGPSITIKDVRLPVAPGKGRPFREAMYIDSVIFMIKGYTYHPGEVPDHLEVYAKKQEHELTFPAAPDRKGRYLAIVWG